MPASSGKVIVRAFALASAVSYCIAPSKSVPNVTGTSSSNCNPPLAIAMAVSQPVPMSIAVEVTVPVPASVRFPMLIASVTRSFVVDVAV